MEKIKKYKSKFKESFHPKDDLLRGMTFEDLITTVQSNEPEVNEKSVMKVYKEILNMQLEDAKSELKSNMKQIIKEAQ